MALIFFTENFTERV